MRKRIFAVILLIIILPILISTSLVNTKYLFHDCCSHNCTVCTFHEILKDIVYCFALESAFIIVALIFYNSCNDRLFCIFHNRSLVSLKVRLNN